GLLIADEEILPVAAIKRIVAAGDSPELIDLIVVAHQSIVAAVAIQEIVVHVADQSVVARTANDAVDPGERIETCAGGCSGAEVAICPVGAVEYRDIKAIAAVQQVVVAVADQCVVAGAGLQALDAREAVVALAARNSQGEIGIDGRGRLEPGEVEAGAAV